MASGTTDVIDDVVVINHNAKTKSGLEAAFSMAAAKVPTVKATPPIEEATTAKSKKRIRNKKNHKKKGVDTEAEEVPAVVEDTEVIQECLKDLNITAKLDVDEI